MYSCFFRKNVLKKIVFTVFLMGGLFLLNNFLAKDLEASAEVLLQSNTNEQVKEYGESKIVNGRSLTFFHPTHGGLISSGFGERWGRMHKGIDIPKEMNTPVVACLDGVVKNIFYEAEGYGKIVILDHGNGLESRYAHLNSYNVKIGDKINAGDKIANVGSTGRSTGPHLHFEIRLNNNPLNPQNYV